MSKQGEAKKKQNYDPKPISRVCMNCEHYKSDIIKGIGIFDEKNKRCGLGEFAVKKMATCDLFKRAT